MGRPFKIIPSPVPGFASWADYFTSEIYEFMDRYGIKPNIFSSYDEYQKGTYDHAIRIVLNNWQKVREIWVRIAKVEKQKDWIPVMPRCENCGRYSTTVAVSWDHEKIGYKCSQDRPYAQSCKYEGEMTPERGNVKLPWRIHWPATWFTFRTTFESGGKDHFAKGGSVDTGHAFMREIFKTEPPYQIGCEFVTIDGKKISGSLGNGVSMKQWLEFAEPELLRFLYISYQTQTVIEFDLRTQKFFLVADRYDEAERCYYGIPSTTEKRTVQLKRQFELAQVGKPPAELSLQVPFSTLVMLVQTLPNRTPGKIIQVLRDMGSLKKEDVAKQDEERVKRRTKMAENWLERYAPDEMRIKLNTEAPAFAAGLNEKQRSAVVQLGEELDKYEKEEELQSRIYDIARENGVEPKAFFRALYQLLINRDAGPRLGPFILAAGKERVSKILRSV